MPTKFKLPPDALTEFNFTPDQKTILLGPRHYRATSEGYWLRAEARLGKIQPRRSPNA